MLKKVNNIVNYTYRLDCYTDCNIGFFPELKCVHSPLYFWYNGNKYTDFYVFKRPNATKN